MAAADGEQRVQGPALPRAPDVGVVWLVLLVYVSGPGLCRGGGGVMGGEEGVVAVRRFYSDFDTVCLLCLSCCLLLV